MSSQILVYVRRADMPSTETWQAAARSSDFPLSLPNDFLPFEQSGYLPVEYDEFETGFEFAVYPLDEAELDAEPELRARIADRDCAASFVIGADTGEWLSACSAAASLASVADGIYFDSLENIVATGPEAVAVARNSIQIMLSNPKCPPARSQFARLPPVEVSTYRPGWVRCPACNWRFSVEDEHAWDGIHHLRCGRKLVVAGQDSSPANSAGVLSSEADDRRWWQFWK